MAVSLTSINFRNENAPDAPDGSDGFVLDRGVVNALGDGEELVSAEPYGNSAWAVGAHISAKRPDDSFHDYFLKIVRGNAAEARVRGEYTCMMELYKTIPSLVPTPRAYGKCLDTPDAYFFLCDFLDIHHPAPDPVKLASRIAELHRKSVSPTGKFGFHVTPYDGKLPIDVGWDGSWTSFFAKLLAGVCELDRRTNGTWAELDEAMATTQRKVIPRLLDALVADGRALKPCLIHGDLWEGNIGTDILNADRLYIFDSCAYYAHHEMAVGHWRVDHHQMNRPVYRDEYFKCMPPDKPVEEWDDRNRLYSVETRIIYSAHVPGPAGHAARTRALEELRYLIAKYVTDEPEDDSTLAKGLDPAAIAQLNSAAVAANSEVAAGINVGDSAVVGEEPAVKVTEGVPGTEGEALRLLRSTTL